MRSLAPFVDPAVCPLRRAEESKANAATAANLAANASYPACPAEIVAATATAASAATLGATGLHLTLLVVGKVTDSVARVLIEILEGGDAVAVTLTCTQLHVRKVDVPAIIQGPDGMVDEKKQSPEPGASSASAAPRAAQGETLPPPITVTQKLQPGRPRIFVFSGLLENAHYSITIGNLGHPQPPNAGFTTMMKDWKINASFPPMRIVTVSCNLLSETLALKKEQTDLWSDMADRVQRGEVDYVLHMGDQVSKANLRAANPNARAPHIAIARDVDPLGVLFCSVRRCRCTPTSLAAMARKLRWCLPSLPRLTRKPARVARRSRIAISSCSQNACGCSNRVARPLRRNTRSYTRSWRSSTGCSTARLGPIHLRRACSQRCRTSLCTMTTISWITVRSHKRSRV